MSFKARTPLILFTKSSLNVSMNGSKISGESKIYGKVEITGSPSGLSKSPDGVKRA